MREAVIVSYARTPIGRAFRGALNRTPSPSLAGHAIEHAVARSKISPDQIDDVIVGTVLTAGTGCSPPACPSRFRARPWTGNVLRA